MATIFDHTKKTFTEAVGFDNQDLKDLSEKLATITKDVLMKEPRISELTEIIANTLSYNDLLIIATTHVIDKTKEIVANHPQILLAGVLKGIINSLEQEED